MPTNYEKDYKLLAQINNMNSAAASDNTDAVSSPRTDYGSISISDTADTTSSATDDKVLVKKTKWDKDGVPDLVTDSESDDHDFRMPRPELYMSDD